MFDVEDLEELREDKFLVEAVLDREGAAVVEVEVLELETPAKSVDDMISEGKDTSMRRSSRAGAESEHTLVISAWEPLGLNPRFTLSLEPSTT